MVWDSAPAPPPAAPCVSPPPPNSERRISYNKLYCLYFTNVKSKQKLEKFAEIVPLTSLSKSIFQLFSDLSSFSYCFLISFWAFGLSLVLFELQCCG